MEHNESIDEKLTTKVFKLSITGMMCQRNCGTTVHNALVKVSGVNKVIVSFENSNAIIYGEQDVSSDELISAVNNIGFNAALIQDKPGPKAREECCDSTLKTKYFSKICVTLSQPFELSEKL